MLARFVPIVRTFTPIVAGVAQMNYRTFVTFNLIGGFLWGVGVTTLGYFLGEIDFVKNNLEIAAVVIVAISAAAGRDRVHAPPQGSRRRRVDGRRRPIPRLTSGPATGPGTKSPARPDIRDLPQRRVAERVAGYT